MTLSKVSVEFYILWSDRTWTTDTISIDEREVTSLDNTDEVVGWARAKMERSLNKVRDFHCVGPLYHISEPE